MKKILKKTSKKEIKKKAKSKVVKKKIKVRVIGIGGGGGSIVSEIALNVKKASFVIANTDIQALKKISKNCMSFQFGQSLTGGLGTGMNPELGSEAAKQEEQKIKRIVQDQDLCIFVVSLGGGAGSGAAPIFAKISKELGNINYGIFTLPFDFEGEKKMEIANSYLSKMKKYLNVYTCIPNQRIFRIIDKKTPLKTALSLINENLTQSLKALIDIIYQPGLINIDFADLKTLLYADSSKLNKNRKKLTYLNTVEISKKDGGAKEAIERMISSDFYPYNIRGAKGILLNITGSKDLSLLEVNQISKSIQELADKEAKIIFGVSQVKKYTGKIKTTLLGVGCFGKSLFKNKSIKKKTLKKKKNTKKEVLKNILKEKTNTKNKVVSNRRKSSKKKVVKKENQKLEQEYIKEEKKDEVVSKVDKPKIRKNALQVREEIDEIERRMLEEERFWEGLPSSRIKNKEENNN